MSRRFRVTRRAVKDLRAIAQNVAEVWGEGRRDACLSNLEARFQWLADNPDEGRPREHIGAGVRSYPIGAFAVFYLVGEDAIDIIAVPHKTMIENGQFGPV